MKILNIIGELYYKCFKKLLIRVLKRHKGIEFIILNGSFARDELRYFKSDVDISIILNTADKKAFQKWYARRLRFISVLFPFFLPISERLHNVFLLEELSQVDQSEAFRAYLKNEPYKVLYGVQLTNCEPSQY